MATQLYSYQDKTGKKRYVGATSLSAAQKQASGSNFSLVEGFSSDKGTTSDKRVAEIASQDFVTPENKQAIQKSFPSQTILDRPNLDEKPVELGLPDNYDSPTDRVQKLTSGLEAALDEARNQRQDSTLDFLGGVIPTGALPATSFASILSSMNRSAAPLEANLTKSALDFAQQELQNVKAQQTDVRNLALTAIESGADQSTINSILKFSETGDINSAITALASDPSIKGSGETIKQIGSNLVKYDKDGNVQVLFSATGGGGTSGGGTSGGGTFDTGGDVIGGGSTDDDAVFSSSESGKTYNLATRQGIAEFKADHPNVTDADIRAKLDAETNLNQSTINGLLEQEESAGLPTSTIDAIAVAYRKAFASFTKNTTEELNEAIEFIKTTKTITLNGDEYELNEKERQLIIDKLNELGERTKLERVLPGGR